MPDTSPFLDQRLIGASLYRDQQRLADRTGAILSAKTSGRSAAEVIADTARRWDGADADGLVLDIGCGRGASTVALARALPRSHILALDASAALLAATRQRLRRSGGQADTVRANFHELPLPSGRAQLAVAAFCLYHSPHPRHVLREIARCMAPGGTAILATKSADSYASLDRLIAASGLDPQAEARPSLYGAFHSGNFAELAATAFTVRDIEHETHRFRFRDLTHAAAYLSTSPKYRLPPGLAGDAGALAELLRQRLPDRPVDTASVVSYLTATVPG
jgi:ubiquinone/menaquinone biosynthesis C-methylase UbiE